MWIRNPGKSRAAAVLGTFLVLAILTAVPALGNPKGEGSPAAPPGRPGRPGRPGLRTRDQL